MAHQKSQFSLNFPLQGINIVAARSDQPPQTCINARNVRAFDSLEDRARGGIRPGLSRYLSTQVDGTNRIQDITHATIVRNVAPNTNGLYIRTVKSVAVSNGTITQFNTTNINAATVSGSKTLNSSVPFIFSTELFGRLYYTDGISYKIWIGSNNTATDWTPSAGSLPGTDGTETPRIIEMWRSRIVMGGLKSDPHNWFMSALGDPLDWDYAPAITVATQAATGGTGVVGKIGDVINALIPYSDDVLIVGCDHSIWALRGDPIDAGGRFDLITDKIGIAFGRAWTKDELGKLYFFSTRGDIYALDPIQGYFKSLTKQSIYPLVVDTNLNTHLVRLALNPEENGFNVFIGGL